MVVFAGGTFEGRDGLRGTIAPGGVDWQLARPDGVLEIDAHYLLLTDGGDQIEVRSRGPPQGERRGGRAHRSGRGGPAIRVLLPHPHQALDARRPAYAWMNDLLAVSTGERRRDKVRIDVHEIG